MRRNLKPICLVTLLILALSLAACSLFEGTQQRLSRELGLDLKRAELLEEQGDHGAFGDGEEIVVLQVPEDARAVLEAQIRDNPDWRPLPMTEAMNEALYSEWPTFTRSSNGTHLFPEVRDGYYFFRNRQKDAEDPMEMDAIWGRASYNFTLALYDRESGKVYYYALDT